MPTTSAGAVALDLKANTKQFERDADAAAGRVKGTFSKASAAIGKALAVGALVSFGKQCVQVASDLAEVQNVVDVAFPTMGARVDEWARSAADAFGLSETMAKRYAGTFGTMAEAFGFAEGQAYGMATALAELSGDVASFYNLSQDEAYTKLKSVFTGETEALKSLGVVMTQAALDQYALANGYGRTVAQMSEQEKVALRLAFVTDALSNAQGDFSRTSNSWANQTKLLQLRIEELKAAVGGTLIVALTPALQLANRVVAAMTSAAQAVYRFVSAIASTGLGRFAKGAAKAVGRLTGNSSEAAESTAALADAQDAAAGAAGGQAAAVGKLNRTLAGFDRINKLTADSAGGGGGAGGGISDAFSALEDAETAASGLQDVLDGIVLPEKLLRAFERLRDVLGDIGRHVGNGLAWAWENVLQPLGRWTVNELAPALVEALAEGLALLDEVAQALSPALGWVFDNVIRPLAEVVGDRLVLALQDAAEWFKIMGLAVKRYVVPFVERLVEGMDRFMDLVKDMLGVTSNGRGGGGTFSLGGGRGFGGGFGNRHSMGTEDGATRWGFQSGGAIANYIGLKPLRQFKAVYDSIKPKSVTLDASIKGYADTDRLRSAFGDIKSKDVTVRALDDASDKLSNIKARLAEVRDKTATINATDNASARAKKAAENIRNVPNRYPEVGIKVYKTGINGVDFKTSLKNGTIQKISAIAFAQGGFVERNTPRLAVIGDNRREGEIVSPESKFRDYLDQAVARGGADPQAVMLLGRILSAVEAIEPAVYIDGRELTRTVVSNVNAQTRATGRCAILI